MERPRPVPPPLRKIARSFRRSLWNTWHHLFRKIRGPPARGIVSEQAGKETGLGAHSSGVLWIGEQDALFGRETEREYDDVSNGSGERGNPCSMNQRQRNHFHEDCCVVGMANVSERPIRDHPEAS